MNVLERASAAETMVDRVTALVPRMQQRAQEADDLAAFPSEDIAALRDAGVLALPLPIEQNPWSDDVGAAVDQLAGILMRIGMGNLAVGRIVEAHINARHLIARYRISRPEGAGRRTGPRGASVRALGHRSARTTICA